MLGEGGTVSKVMYAAAGLLADVFGMFQLWGVARIFAIGVPFFAAIRVLVVVYRGFDFIREQKHENYLSASYNE